MVLESLLTILIAIGVYFGVLIIFPKAVEKFMRK